jgi:molecular chaperone GrpE
VRYNAWVALEKWHQKSTLPGVVPGPQFEVRNTAEGDPSPAASGRNKGYLRELAFTAGLMPAKPDSEPVETAEEATATPAATPEAAAPDDWATRYKYLYADFENYRRRTERERENLSRQVRGAMIREMLPILEAFRAGRDAAAQLPADHPLRRGLDLLEREWSTFLKHEGVEPVVSVGTPFRPEEAVAVGEAPVSDRTPDGTVAEVVQQGYRFFGGIVRPAKVIVARGAPEAEASAAVARSDPE